MAYTTINKSTDYFNPKSYTGTGGEVAVTGVGHQPDFTWIKSMNATEGHVLTDSVRGVTKYMISNATGVEVTNTDTLRSFNSDGFTIGPAGVTGSNNINYVSWNWKAGTAVSGNTSGSGTYKTYTGSVNTTSGFSIITYTGNGSAGHTIPHHLGVAPKFIIVKSRTTAGENWIVYHSSRGATAYLILASNGGSYSSVNAWNNTTPTSTVFSIGGQGGDCNRNGENYVAYCFAEKQGFSKFGKYLGNNSTDGTFTYLGFKPAFIMIKKTSGSSDWAMFDNKRQGYNVANNLLYPNNTTADTTGTFLDLLSNGFKMRTTASWSNDNGSDYYYMAWAEAPLVASNGVAATAR